MRCLKLAILRPPQHLINIVNFQVYIMPPYNQVCSFKLLSPLFYITLTYFICSLKNPCWLQLLILCVLFSSSPVPPTTWSQSCPTGPPTPSSVGLNLSFLQDAPPELPTSQSWFCPTGPSTPCLLSSMFSSTQTNLNQI